MYMCEKRSIVELREIYSCLALSKNIGAKAFISFILSSGMNRNIAMSLTIENLLDSCHKDSLNALLKCNPNNIIPEWVFETEETFKLNFSSPESLFYIFLHLKERLSENNLKTMDKLFDIASSTLDDNFRLSEKLTKMGSYYPPANDGVMVSHKFTAKTLQEFFINQYLNYAPNHENGKHLKYRHKSYSQYKVKTIKLFTTGLSKDDSFYKNFLNNHTRLRIDYQKVLPYITVKNYDIISPSWQIKVEDELEELIKSRNNSEKKSYTYVEVTEIVNDYIKHTFKDKHLDDDYLEQIFKFAHSDNKIGYFEDSKLYFGNLMLKPLLKDDIESIISEPIEIPILTQTEMISDLVLLFDENNLFDEYRINKDIFSFNIQDAIDFYGDDGKQRFITADYLLEVCFFTMMERE